MLKSIIIFEGTRKGYSQSARGNFCSFVQQEVVGRVREYRPRHIKVSLTEDPPPAVKVIPFKKNFVACLSIVSDKLDFVADLQSLDEFRGAYQVEEALPVSYEPNWKLGQPTPGACLLTLFRKKAGIARDEFIDRWHNGHTPLTLKLHPLWNYNRNLVTASLVETSPVFDGIVEEQVRHGNQLTNPFLFFGGMPHTLGNMLEVWKDVRKFIDYKSIETYLATEYIIL